MTNKPESITEVKIEQNISSDVFCIVEDDIAKICPSGDIPEGVNLGSFTKNTLVGVDENNHDLNQEIHYCGLASYGYISVISGGEISKNSKISVGEDGKAISDSNGFALATSKASAGELVSIRWEFS